jgi:hypothetical protein
MCHGIKRRGIASSYPHCDANIDVRDETYLSERNGESHFASCEIVCSNRAIRWSKSATAEGSIPLTSSCSILDSSLS